MNLKTVLSVNLILMVFYFNSEASQLSDDRNVYETWIEIVENTYQHHTEDDPVIYTVIAENFYRIYRETNNAVYLNFALHEAGRSVREEIFERLSDEEIESNALLIDKLYHNRISPDLYNIREFSPGDIYLFYVHQVPEEYQDNALELLDYWYDKLPDLFVQDPLKATFKAQSLVIGYHRIRDYGKIVELSKLLRNDTILPVSIFKLNMYEMMIYPLYIRGEYSLLLNLFNNSLLPIVNELNEPDKLANLKMDFASTLFLIGNVNDALEVYISVYNETENIEEYSFYRSLLNNLSLAYWYTGNFDDYITFQLKSYDLAYEELDLKELVDIFENLYHHQVRNDRALALDYLNQALEIARSNDLKLELSGLLSSKGQHSMIYQNNPSLALEIYYDALDILAEVDNYFVLRNTLFGMAEAYNLVNDHSNAENYFLKAIEVSSSGNDPAGHLLTSMNYATWLIKNNRSIEANEVISNFIPSDIEALSFMNRVLYYNTISNLYYRNGNISEAAQTVGPLLDEVIDWMHQSSDQQTGHMQIPSYFGETIRLNTQLSQIKGNYEEALAISGKVRNISRTGFYNNPALKSSLLSEEELIQDYNLGVRIQQLRNMYTDANDQQRNRIRAELTNAMAERNLLMNNAFPRYIESQYEDLIQNPRRILNRGEMVIYFAKYENQLFQFFVTRSGVDMKSYPDDHNFYQLIDDAISSFGYRSTDLNLMHQIYTTFFEGNIPSDIKHVFIVPDDELYRIPFEIMPVKPVDSPDSYGSARYFIEEYSISYLNTLSDLTKEQRGSNGYFAYDIAGFGISNFSEAGHRQMSDLPFSPIEVINSINNLSSLNKNQIFIDKYSTESNFKKTAGNARIIHVATHSQVIDNNPLLSSFYMYSQEDQQLDTDTGTQFTHNSQNDGIVRAFEIFDLNLDADMVFLSSCESGSGGYLQGTGILGFSRAFSYAGAKSLIMNLWPVRDQTSAEMTPQFYDFLNTGMNKAEAIQQTKINYMNQRDSDPYLWGSFVIYGNTDPIIDKRDTLFQVTIAFLSLIGIYLLVSFVRRLFHF